MKNLPISAAGRRAFLQRAGQLSLAGVAAPWALNLATMADAAAETATDYKALVCVFLYGGNDHYNTLPPYDSASHAEYVRLRGADLATARAKLAGTVLTPSVALPNGRQMAVAPELAPLHGLFQTGQMGVMLNVGTLIEPTTLAQYNSKGVRLPPRLFSHNDQQSVWQSSSPEGAVSGWGGRIGDMIEAVPGKSTFTCINVSGNAVFMSGRGATQYQITPTGAVALNGVQSPLFGSKECSEALRAITTASRTHLIEAEHTRVMARSVAAYNFVTDGLAKIKQLQTPFAAANPLAMQLQMVAKLIAARATLKPARQVFFVSLGGFDTHDSQLERQPPLLSSVAGAIKSFYDATVELGVANSVTTFTGSDFGRTLTSNGDGSDHGWGSHQFVVGGAVKGNQFYGTLPDMAINGASDVGNGRLLPTTSVDQFAATMAKWMGVSDKNLPLVVPNIGNYTTRDLGIFK